MYQSLRTAVRKSRRSPDLRRAGKGRAGGAFVRAISIRFIENAGGGVLARSRDILSGLQPQEFTLKKTNALPKQANISARPGRKGALTNAGVGVGDRSGAVKVPGSLCTSRQVDSIGVWREVWRARLSCLCCGAPSAISTYHQLVPR